MKPHVIRLMRQATDAEQSSLQCSFGYTPRKGKLARRARDCTITCTDYGACEAQAKQAIWLTDPKRGEK